jgi:hypothetical protein
MSYLNKEEKDLVSYNNYRIFAEWREIIIY